MSERDAKLVYVANQIARNFAHQGEGPAAAATADHIGRFWDPGMKARIMELAGRAEHGLGPIALGAVRRLPAPAAR
jgi:formate dehydrogenase subunit delta